MIESILNEVVVPALDNGQAMITNDFEVSSRPVRFKLDHPSDHPVLALVFQKWSSIILLRIRESPVRFNRLVRELAINPNTLQTRLRVFESESLIERVFESGTPTKILYVLTPKGLEFTEIIKQLHLWIESHDAPE